MEAPRSLSVSQRNSLESILTCLKGCSAFLNSNNSFTLEDRESSRALCLWAELCEHKLVESFPELHLWLDEWTRGGGLQ